VRALDLKLLRDLLRMRLQVAAIALLITCGVSVAVMAFSAQAGLKRAQSQYYAQTGFADVFAGAKRAPLAVAVSLGRIPGVVAVDARATKGGLMSLPGMLRPATATLIGLPDDPRQALNRLVLMQGRLPDAKRTDEAVALKSFLDAAHVALGDRLTMVIDGRQMSFRITGSVLSPEYVYVPGPASSMPDDAHRGVFWAPRLTVEKAAGLGGAFSAVSLKLAAGSDPAPVLAAVDRALSPYGGFPAVARADQISHKVVAASLVAMVLGRLVETEREQIGLLKAFGYGDFAAAAVYLKLAALIGLIGAAGGGVLGAWMARAVTQVLAQYMRFPSLHMRFSWTAFAAAALISAAAAAAGSLMAVRRAVRLSPAVAMRPPAPAVFRQGLVERLAIWRRLDQPTRMIVRNLERFPARALLTCVGLAVSLSLVVGSQFVFGSFDEILDQAYFRARHWTDFVGFAENRDVSAVASVGRMPGVIAAEPARFAAIRARANGREQRGFITGLDPAAWSTRPLDAADQVVPLKGRGVVLSSTLARRLDVQPGQSVEIEIVEGRRPRVLLPITGEAQDYAGLSVYMDRHELNALMGDGDVASTALLLVAPDQRAQFYRAIERAPQIVAAESRADTVIGFRTTMMQIMSVEMSFFAAFAATIAFGVAFNVSRIALSDRARDLATLRVLGFEPFECAYILLGELGLLALLAIPLGVLGGIGLADALVASFASQELQLPMIITARSYGLSISTFLAAVALAAAMVGGRIWSLDLVAVLKTRE
jgi:putative ABC transport system permease protein